MHSAQRPTKWASFLCLRGSWRILTLAQSSRAGPPARCNSLFKFAGIRLDRGLCDERSFSCPASNGRLRSNTGRALKWLQRHPQAQQSLTKFKQPLSEEELHKMHAYWPQQTTSLWGRSTAIAELPSSTHPRVGAQDCWKALLIEPQPCSGQPGEWRHHWACRRSAMLSRKP
jgi:hypothetical protein